MINRIKVDYLSYKKIEDISVSWLEKYQLKDTIPIDIEKLLDNQLRLNIIPFPNLLNNFEINAFTSSDLRKIYVDEYLYTNLEQQFRFTLAHELGHNILHSKIYRQVSIKDISSYVDFLNKIDEREYSYLEFQANCFAGLFLIPSKHLEAQFKNYIEDAMSFITRKFRLTKRNDYLDLAIMIIAKKLNPIFKVHPRPIEIRIEKQGLAKLIP
jgi:Zn-dependent peptidase ImmA (M78 family)